MVKLNLGCGTNRIEGCTNIDVEPSCNPDLVIDFLKDRLPFDTNYIDEIYLFHTIEHITKSKHNRLLSEIHRILKPSGRFICSFPEFKKCYENWRTNRGGKREFWEATLYGRQLYPSDYHVCIMDSDRFHQNLLEIGFKDFIITPEPEPNEFNTIISCHKGTTLPAYEKVVKDELDSLTLIQVSFND